MAGNIQADTSGDIFVEVDENNIIVVDPNKTRDNFGNIRERLVDHENLVMYANLEADVIPRTKLAVGGSPDRRLVTISVTKMNFLKPTKNSSLGTGYYDELTGENTTQFNSVNQPNEIANTTNSSQDPNLLNTSVNQREIIDTGFWVSLQLTLLQIQVLSQQLKYFWKMYKEKVSLNLVIVHLMLHSLINHTPHSILH
jgi:hypothetical protein